MDAGEALGLILYVALVVGILHIIVGIIRWTLGSEKYRNHLLWGFILLVMGSGGISVLAWLLGGLPGGGGGAQGEFIIVPADYYQSNPGELNAAQYYPVSVTVYPVWSNYEKWDVCVDWGETGGLCTIPQNGTGPVKLEHTYNSTGTYTVSVTVRGCTLNIIGVCQWETVKQVSFNVRVTAPWYEYSETVKEALEETPEDGGTIEKGVVRALKKVGIGLAGAWAKITDFLARWMSQLGIQPGDAYYYLVAMPTTDNLPALKAVYNEYRYWGTWIIFVLALAAILWKGLFEYEEGGGALFKWLRDLLLVLAGLYIALPLYDAAAKAWNVMTLSVARLDQLGAIYVMFTVGILLLSAVGMLNPSAGVLAANMTIVLLLTIVLGVLKWIATAVLVAILPLAIALWLWEGTRSVAASMFRMLTGMFVFTAAAAALTALTVEFSLTLTQTGTGKNLLFAAALPIISTVAGYWITGAIMPGALPGSGFIAHRILGRGGGAAAAGAAIAPAMAGILARPPTPYPPTTVPQAGAPGAAAAPVALSGAVVGSVPTPTAGAASRIGYVHTGPPMIGPSPAGLGRQEKPREVTSLTPPGATTRRQRATGAIRTLHEMATGKAKPAPTAPKRVKAAYYAARATSKLASHVKRQLLDFDRVLQRELGISLIEKPITKRAIPAAKHTIKVARWAAPRTVRLVRGAKEKIKAYWSGQKGTDAVSGRL